MSREADTLAAAVGQHVRDARAVEAVRAVPRHLFVPSEWRADAYADEALPLGDGQTISQPTVVARMAELAELRPYELALEVGGGSGYAAAVLAQLCAHVVSIELRARLAAGAQQALEAAGVGNVDVVVGDGALGYPERAPFDAIVVSAAAVRVPEALVEQLAPGGRLVLPLGRRRQRLVRVRRTPGGELEREVYEAVRFVPLTRGF